MCPSGRILQEAIAYVRELKGLTPGARAGSDDDGKACDDDGMQFEMEDVAESEGGAGKPSHNEVPPFGVVTGC